MLMRGECAALTQQCIDEGGFAVVYVGNDGYGSYFFRHEGSIRGYSIQKKWGKDRELC